MLKATTTQLQLLLCCPCHLSSDAASAIYFMDRKSEKPIKQSDIIEFYKGVV